MNKSSGLE